MEAYSIACESRRLTSLPRQSIYSIISVDKVKNACGNKRNKKSGIRPAMKEYIVIDYSEVNSMTHSLVGVLLYTNILVVGWLYFHIRKIRKLIGFQLGMNIAMVVGGLAALSTGILLILQFPLYFTPVTIVSTFVGMSIGTLFGLLFDYQTALTGFTNGVFMGVMAPMIGALIETYISFIIFLESLLIVSLVLVMISIRRS